MKQDETPFRVLAENVRTQAEKMIKGADRLYVAAVDKDELWDLYLKSFPEGTDPIFRTRTEHDCSTCRHFIKTFGGVVAIKNGVVSTIWDFWPKTEGRYAPVAKALDLYVRSKLIADVFITDARKIGAEKNHEMLENEEVIAWDHFYVDLPGSYPITPRSRGDQARGEARTQKEVFNRSLEEISESSVDTVLELIASNSLYRGEEWKGALEAFKAHVRVYPFLNENAKELYAWEKSGHAGPVVGKIKNHSIGLLLQDITKGIDLDEAVRKYEAIVAPSNYKRPKAIFSERMVKDAEKTITELGYLPSLGRRFAEMDDINVGDILFVNRDVAPRLRGGNVFDSLAKSVPKKFDRLEEVPLDVFVTDVLPIVQKVEVLLENRHGPNLVSLIAPLDDMAPSMFKWPNGFAWAYNGNMADSMKERVKAAGGNVEGDLRFSIMWDHNDDLDAHCIEPDGNEIYFTNKARVHPSSGVLDVDIIDPSRDARVRDGVAVENISWSNLRWMPEGVYEFFVHCYSSRGARSGFSAEVEFDGQIYSFAYNRPLHQNERVQVAEVTYTQKTGFTISEKIPSSMASRNLWGLDTGQFHQVSVIMFSPNYWNGQDGIGNRHVFFMVDGCKNPDNPNGFFNEYLKNDLLKHKRVFEALGGKMRVVDSDDQLSGVGFSTTQRNEVTVRVTGNVTRILKVKI
jgi:hypothetical protein